jgi:uncharacterized phiE125 gp8 family phage protein
VFFNGENPITLPFGPLVSVTSLVDDNDTTLTDYDVSAVGKSDRVKINEGFSAPLTVTYQAGYASASDIPASIRHAILTHVATLFENRESVSDRAKLPVPHSLEAFYQRKSRKVPVG